MSEPLENLYFNWLYAKVVRPVPNATPSNTYYNLLKVLHNTEFVWLLSGDDNRAEDGKELRREFLIMAEIPDHLEWRTMTPCSFLEMLIAFAKRAELNSETTLREWFWEMLENINLAAFCDAHEIDPSEIEEVLEHMMWRQYPPNGDGSLFPLNTLDSDQTQQEIWHQFCDYLVDQNRLP